MAPKNTNTPELAASSTAASTGKKAGAKRPAAGQAGQAVNPPTRRVSTQSSSSSDSNPSRPGSSGAGGYHLNNFSYYRIIQGADPKHKEDLFDPQSVEFRLVSAQYSPPSAEPRPLKSRIRNRKTKTKLTRQQVADAYHIGWQRFKHADTAKAFIHFGQGCAASWTDTALKKERGNYKWAGDKSKIHVYHNNFIKGLAHTTPAIGKQRFLAGGTGIFAECCLENTYKGSIDSVLNTRDLFHIEFLDLVRICLITLSSSLDSIDRCLMDSLLIPALNCYQFADHLVDAYNRHEDDRYPQAAHPTRSVLLPRARACLGLLPHRVRLSGLNECRNTSRVQGSMG